MNLSDIKIIDLRHSVIDKEQSDPRKGKYVFTKKSYISYTKDDSVRPPWKFSWNNDSPYAHQDWCNKWPGTEFVTVKDDYYPEGATLKADGHWYFKDAVLEKIPLLTYIQQRRKEIERSEKAPERILAATKAEFKSYGVDLSDDELDAALGSRG